MVSQQRKREDIHAIQGTHTPQKRCKRAEHDDVSIFCGEGVGTWLELHGPEQRIGLFSLFSLFLLFANHGQWQWSLFGVYRRCCDVVVILLLLYCCFYLPPIIRSKVQWLSFLFSIQQPHMSL